MAVISWTWMYKSGGGAQESDATALIAFDAPAVTLLASKGQNADASYQWRTPVRDRVIPRHLQPVTVSGTIRDYTMGQDGRTIFLNFRNLPAGSDANVTDLRGVLGIEEFFTNANGPNDWGNDVFDFYPPGGLTDGSGLPVRYAGGFENFVNTSGVLYDGQIILRKELS